MDKMWYIFRKILVNKSVKNSNKIFKNKYNRERDKEIR